MEVPMGYHPQPVLTGPGVRYDVDFGTGASLLRIKGTTDSKLVIRVYADSMEGNPIATAVFIPVTKENRLKINLSGVHSLYFIFEGEGTLTSWQAFTSQEEIDAALKAERGTVYEDQVPSAYTKLAEQRGTIEKFVYEAHDYFGDNSLYEKTAFVYLPYGYDPAQTYDLLILCHGIGGSEYEWGMTGEESRLKRIMDNLIDSGEIKPFIVVTPNGRAGKSEDHSSFYRFDEELRNDLLPALAERYAVDIHDRSRCAMAGLSMGGMQTINIGLCECLDIISAFGAFSAAPTSYTSAVIAAKLAAFPEEPIRYFYNICGTEDSIAYDSASKAAKQITQYTDRLNGDNFCWQERKGGHDFNIWNLGLYNFLKIIGRPDGK